MSFAPNDLITDADLADYESAVLTKFGQTTWQARRTKALEDWLFPILKGNGFDPQRLRTRFECDAVLGFTGSAYSDKTSAAKDTSEDDLNLATIFASVGSDALYIGSTAPFRGLFLRLNDSISSAAGVLSVAYWNGNWETLTISDATTQVAGKTLSAGGAVTWILPLDWARRQVNSNGTPYYWVKLTISATPSSAKATQIGVIRASVLRAPATLRTLTLVFREAPTKADGPWTEKADYYEKEADAALQRALLICGGEFDTGETPGSDLISPTEAAQTVAEVGGGWHLERG